MIETILATDITHHVKNLNTIKSKFDSFGVSQGKNYNNLIFEDNVIKTYENQQAVLSLCVHCADTSNSAKPENISKAWIDLEFEELFNQGDFEREQELPISLLCDRKTTSKLKSQIAFINLAVKPAFEILLEICPENSVYLETIKENQKRYENLAEKELLTDSF